MFDDIDLYNRVAKEATSKYEFGDRAETSLICMSENITYLISNPETGEKKGVLRVGRPGYHTLPEYEGEIAWLRQINDYTPLIVAHPITAKDGSYIQQIDGDGTNFFCIVTQFLEGKTWAEDDESKWPNHFKVLGETTAYLHRQTKIWNGTKQIKRWVWDYDNVIGKNAKWGDWRDFHELTPSDTAAIEKCCAIIEKRLNSYGQTEDNFGLIHTDLRIPNLLFEGDQIKVIDFDDCGFGWYIQDLANALTFIEERDIVPELVNSWLDGYRRIQSITDTDFVEIDTFILMRRLQMVAWLESHIGNSVVDELTVGFLDGTMGLVERYLRNFA